MSECLNCDNTGWVCEGHNNKPWDGMSGRVDACGCGPGEPCKSPGCPYSVAQWKEGEDTIEQRVKQGGAFRRGETMGLMLAWSLSDSPSLREKIAQLARKYDETGYVDLHIGAA